MPAAGSLQDREDLLGVRLRGDLRVGVRDLPIGTDDVADPLGELARRRLGRPVGDSDLAIDVAEQGEREPLLLREDGVLLDRVEGGAQDLGVLLLELGVVVAEPATLLRSPGGAGLRIEPENEILPAVVREPAGHAVLVLDSELRSLVSDGQHLRPPQDRLQDPDDR
jgi:hypothetical protein